MLSVFYVDVDMKSGLLHKGKIRLRTGYRGKYVVFCPERVKVVGV